MLGLCHFIFATFPHEKFFTVTVNVTVTVVPPTFWNLAKNWKSIFLGQKYLTEGFFFKTYMKVWVLRHTFLKEKNMFLFFCIFYEFLKKNISVSEKITQLFCRLQSKILLHDRVFWQFSTRTQYICLCGKLSNVPKIAPSGLCKWQNHFFPKTRFLTNWRFH